jgi:predicted transcriptional regulator YdeE
MIKQDKSASGEFEKIALSETKFAGVSFPCTNKDLMDTNFISVQNGINTLFSLNVPNVISSNLYEGMINPSEDYKKDRVNGKYDCFIGFQVSSFENMPEGITTFTIPAKSAYKVFTTETGKLQEVIFKKWFSIWGDAKLSNERSYIFDFNLYSGGEDFNNSNIKIYIGTK